MDLLLTDNLNNKVLLTDINKLFIESFKSVIIEEINKLLNIHKNKITKIIKNLLKKDKKVTNFNKTANSCLNKDDKKPTY